MFIIVVAVTLAVAVYFSWMLSEMLLSMMSVQSSSTKALIVSPLSLSRSLSLLSSSSLSSPVWLLLLPSCLPPSPPSLPSLSPSPLLCFVVVSRCLLLAHCFVDIIVIAVVFLSMLLFYWRCPCCCCCGCGGC